MLRKTTILRTALDCTLPLGGSKRIVVWAVHATSAAAGPAAMSHAEGHDGRGLLQPNLVVQCKHSSEWASIAGSGGASGGVVSSHQSLQLTHKR